MDDTDDDGSNLASQELQERARECRAQNTRKTTKWAVGIFEKWARRRAGFRPYIKENILHYIKYPANILHSAHARYEHAPARDASQRDQGQTEASVCQNP